MSEKCPECGYDFSNKKDFLDCAQAGEIIQCPNCGTELEVTKDKQVKAVVMENLDWGEAKPEPE